MTLRLVSRQRAIPGNIAPQLSAPWLYPKNFYGKQIELKLEALGY